MPKVTLKRNDCINCSSCTLYDPNSYEINETDGKAFLKNGKRENNIDTLDILEHDIEVHNQAAESCPTNCIRVQK